MKEKIDIAIEIMQLFRRHDCNAYLVGGSVRDLLLDRPIKDIDIATNCKPDDVELIALSNNLQFIPTGLQHGTVTIIYKGIPIEVTTFRIDKKCYGRRADIQFVCTINLDLSRRDFTINALAMDIEGNLIDPFYGRDDLTNGIIRTVGDPDKRFEEDKLRIMRAIRLATVLDFSIDPGTFDAIKRMDLVGISNERIRDEFIKILESPHRYEGLVLLDESGILNQILPEVTDLKGVTQDPKHHPEKDTFIHTMLTIHALPSYASLDLSLSALLHDIGKPATREVKELPSKERLKPPVTEDTTEIHFYEHEVLGAEMAENILYRLKFPKETIDKVKWLIANHMRIHEFSNMRKAKKIRLIQEQYFGDLLELLRADIMGSSAITTIPIDFSTLDTILEFMKEYNEEIKKRPPPKVRLLTGYDIINLGVKPGKEIGDILEVIEDEVLEENIRTREEALELAKELVIKLQ